MKIIHTLLEEYLHFCWSPAVTPELDKAGAVGHERERILCSTSYYHQLLFLNTTLLEFLNELSRSRANWDERPGYQYRWKGWNISAKEHILCLRCPSCCVYNIPCGHVSALLYLASHLWKRRDVCPSCLMFSVAGSQSPAAATALTQVGPSVESVCTFNRYVCWALTDFTFTLV